MIVCFDSPIVNNIDESSVITQLINVDSANIHIFDVESSLESEC